MKQIRIYSKDYCPYCRAAKQILDAKGLSYIEIDVLKQPEKLTEMLERSQRRTVPQIFFNDEHIGGYTDLVDYYRNRQAA